MIDDIDLKIIYHLYNLNDDEQITTYELAKRIFSFDSSNRVVKNNLVTRRLQLLSKYGIIEINKIVATNYYDLIADKVYFEKFKINGSTLNGMLVNLNGNWNMFCRSFF